MDDFRNAELSISRSSYFLDFLTKICIGLLLLVVHASRYSIGGISNRGQLWVLIYTVTAVYCIDMQANNLLCTRKCTITVSRSTITSYL
jgi:hypothetical protein